MTRSEGIRSESVLDAVDITGGESTPKYRQIVVLGSPDNIDARAGVTPADGSYGANIFSQELTRISGLLRELSGQQRLTNRYLSEIVGDNLGDE